MTHPFVIAGAAKQSGSFLKKRTKKLSLLEDLATPPPQPAVNKSFLLLFFKEAALS
jgi:hypothetical protein